MAERRSPSVTAEGLVAGYGPPARRPDVLRGLDLEVVPGVITAVVGPNGAGKSTLFRTLLGLLPPRAGRVAVGGRPPREHRAHHGFGYLPESVVLPRGWTAGGWVRCGARLRGVPPTATPSRAEEALAAMGIGAHQATRLERLSRGTARRVALAWVLVGGPSVVLLDEPLAGLDAPSRRRVRQAVGDLRRRGVTTMVATHELAEVPRLADRVVVLFGGRIVARSDRPDPEVMEAWIVRAEQGAGP